MEQVDEAVLALEARRHTLGRVYWFLMTYKPKSERVDDVQTDEARVDGVHTNDDNTDRERMAKDA